MSPPLVYEPNVQPDGIEVAGDRHWRDWRLRKRRPDLRQRFTTTFPDVNPELERRALAAIDRQDSAVARDGYRFQARSLDDIPRDGSYKVDQLQFRPLQATQDRVDTIWTTTRPRRARPQDELDRLPSFFFEELTTSLFARVWDFAAETVGQTSKVGDRTPQEIRDEVASQDWTGSFLQHLPDDFVRCISQTARADPVLRSRTDPTAYEHLFVARESRIGVCTSVIAKLLQENCFESLLFGARKIERDTLKKLDESQEDTADGFARKMSRSASVPKYLLHDLFTENFWPEVDRITLGILELLLPFINFAGDLDPYAPWLPLKEVHQNLHNIVAEAGWLANGLALTRSCFWIDFPQPGQLWDLRQEHVSDAIWKNSTAIAQRRDARHLARRTQKWAAGRDAAMMSIPPSRKITNDEYAAFSALYAETQDPKPTQTIRRTAKVQISLWPFFERSYPYRQDLVSGDMNSGESTMVIQKAQVVYYAGVDSDEAEQAEDLTLEQYLNDYRRSKSIFTGRRAFITWPVVLALLSLLLYAAYPGLVASFQVAKVTMGEQSGASFHHDDNFDHDDKKNNHDAV